MVKSGKDLMSHGWEEGRFQPRAAFWGGCGSPPAVGGGVSYLRCAGCPLQHSLFVFEFVGGFH